MADPFIGEVKMVAFNYPPEHWAFCNGQILQINQNQTLYSLLSTYYGGDGRATFGLPDLRGRTPVGLGTTYPIGQKQGLPSVTLAQNQLPGHSHRVMAICDPDTSPTPVNHYADQTLAEGNMPASMDATEVAVFASDTTTLKALDGIAVENSGGNSPHNNFQPGLAVHFCIALQGLYPSRS